MQSGTPAIPPIVMKNAELSNARREKLIALKQEYESLYESQREVIRSGTMSLATLPKLSPPSLMVSKRYRKPLWQIQCSLQPDNLIIIIVAVVGMCAISLQPLHACHGLSRQKPRTLWQRGPSWVLMCLHAVMYSARAAEPSVFYKLILWRSVSAPLRRPAFFVTAELS